MASQNTSVEEIIEPDLPIVDPHHHLWSMPPAIVEHIIASFLQKPEADDSIGHIIRSKPRYLFEELLADATSGHNVRATVFMEAQAMYRSRGPEHLRSVGEIEFVNGVAAMADSGLYGDVKLCAGIVGHVDLRGDHVEEALRAQIKAGGERYRGIRQVASADPDPVLAGSWTTNPPRLMHDEKFRAGFKWLHRLGLSFDTWLVEPQLPELTDLARAFPDTQIILDHLGSPLGIGGYKGKREERFPIWRDNIRTLSKCDNVVVKLGGLAMPTTGFRWFCSDPPATSAQLATDWKPYIEACIEAFGTKRCMFESNFPVDSGCCTYPILWNAFKRITAGASKDDKTALYSDTATRVYRLDI